jgi:pre-mRNA-splicing factor ATP-dependent RNA helicase DHX38/PRP16
VNAEVVGAIVERTRQRRITGEKAVYSSSSRERDRARLGRRESEHSYRRSSRESDRDYRESSGSRHGRRQHEEHVQQRSGSSDRDRSERWSDFSPRQSPSGRSAWDNGRWEWDDTPRRDQAATPGRERSYAPPSPAPSGRFIPPSPAESRLPSPWEGSDSPYIPGTITSSLLHYLLINK